jgi:hypothetical protein
MKKGHAEEGRKMNKRLEDRIAMLAFGDLTESEAAQVRAMAEGDAEAAQVLRAYESMRSDLRLMSGAVPADQLSKERLQDAILKRGLKPQPQPRRWLGWVMAPAAMTVIFALVLAFQMERQPTPVAYNDEPVVESANREGAPEVDPAKKVDTTSLALNAPAPEPVAVKTAPLSTKKTPKQKPSGGTRVAQLDNQPVEEVKKSVERTVARIPNPMEAPTIVLIQNDKDMTTGALRAVETEAFSGVLVGS